MRDITFPYAAMRSYLCLAAVLVRFPLAAGALAALSWRTSKPRMLSNAGVTRRLHARHTPQCSLRAECICNVPLHVQQALGICAAMTVKNGIMTTLAYMVA